MNFTPSQLALLEQPLNARVLLTGAAGTGKTTAAVQRLLSLIESGVPADSILILTPQRALQDPYTNALLTQQFAGGEVTTATMGGLARRMCDLFWPVVAEQAGFARPDLPPNFLTLETAQYYMAQLVHPLLDEGFFESLTIDRNRLYSQIIDNLNKSAVVGFPVSEIGERLLSAGATDPAQRRIYADAHECANRFRTYCLENNLLDFSLQFEIFANTLWYEPAARDYLTQTYRHLVYDNLEEDGARAHDLLEDWLPDLESALLICDDDGGFRQFLGADPVSATRFQQRVDSVLVFDESFVQSPAIIQLETSILHALDAAEAPGELPEEPPFAFIFERFYPQLLDHIVARVAQEQVEPGEIAIVTPYLSDALRFSLMNRLEAAGIPTRSHRPSRSLRDEPASQSLLTLAALAHPGWGITPTRFDLAYAFVLTLECDLIRAQLLADIVYRPRDLRLTSFDDIQPEMQERITYALGERYNALQAWLDAYRSEPPLPFDHFLRKLFGDLLSLPGFGFHTNLDSARVAASLIESVRKFRLALEPVAPEGDLGKQYLQMLQDGVLAAQYLQAYQQEQNAVLVSPATTFLLMNYPVRVQYWLDVGSSGWSERLAQPLTHPYVLSRNWERDRLWTDADEVEAERQSMLRLTSGLLRRCREQIYLCLPELGEAGFEQRGALLRVFQRVLQGG
jgi:hypothetical protein